jgi:hypothetical protein
MKKIRNLAVLFVVPLLLGACSDSKTGPKDGDKGGEFFVTADLSGSYKGKFNATGSAGFNPDANSVAMGFWEGEGADKALMVMGMEIDGKSTSNPETFRTLSLFLINPKPGTYGADQFCLDEDEDEFVEGMSCVMVTFIAKDATSDAVSIMTSGTVKITALTNGRVVGTFEGAGITYEDEMTTTSSIQIKDGRFDVGIFDITDNFLGDLHPNTSWRSRLDALIR